MRRQIISPTSSQPASDSLTRTVRSALNGPSAPLPATVRAPFEAGLGLDLSRVRVHTDATAAASATALAARAYTVGVDVVFGRGAYTPETRAGRHLLAHELVHVAQGSLADGGAALGAATGLCEPGDAAEREAAVAAAAFDRGTAPARPIREAVSPAAIHRATASSGPAPANGLNVDVQPLLPLLGKVRLDELLAEIAVNPAALAFVQVEGAPAILALDFTDGASGLKVEEAKDELARNRASFRSRGFKDRQVAMDPKVAMDGSLDSQQEGATDGRLEVELAKTDVLRHYLGDKPRAPSRIHLLDESNFAAAFIRVELSPSERQDPAKRRAEQVRARRIGGFTERTRDHTNVGIVLNRAHATTVAVAHEYVHTFTHKDFARLSPRALEEGATQYFALRALSQLPGRPTPGDTYAETYREGGFFVRFLVGIIGEQALGDAYFRGDWKALTNAIVGAVGKQTFKDVEQRLRADDAVGARELLQRRAR